MLFRSGHSDVVAGLAVVGDNRELADRLGYLQNAVGGVLDPFSSFLTLRGIRTLALRVEKHSANALAIAQWLEQHPQVEKVWFPWLESHPHYQLARALVGAPDGSVMVRGERRGKPEDAVAMGVSLAEEFLATDVVIAGISVIALIAFALELGLRALQRRLTPWHGVKK